MPVFPCTLPNIPPIELPIFIIFVKISMTKETADNYSCTIHEWHTHSPDAEK